MYIYFQLLAVREAKQFSDNGYIFQDLYDTTLDEIF